MFYVSTYFVFGNVEEGRFLESVFLFFGLKVFVISVRPGEKYSFLFSNDCVPFIEKTVLFLYIFNNNNNNYKRNPHFERYPQIKTLNLGLHFIYSI